jgi:2-polyprenyl-3-methyl-5-hydroxy-6-metoxy-1,4-benzoquinol methylase
MRDLVRFEYQGQELDIFAHAKRWKEYWARRIRPWVHGDVLEVGAGLGVNTLLLQRADARSWHCLEPDPKLAAQLAGAVAHLHQCFTDIGTIANVSDRRFDSILYIDVLEHIEADREELAMAAKLLRPQGHLIVLSPAHQFLFSEFDAAIGHYRRYNKAMLRARAPAECHLEAIFYLDCVGMLASVANRMMLRQSTPTLAQIKVWDTHVIPLSMVLDPLFRYCIGKSIIAVWKRE